jgi:hypothetical protein
MFAKRGRLKLASTDPSVSQTRSRLSGISSDRERARLHLVKIVFIVYWLLIFEGVLRKWAFPSLQKFLYFIRDPFVLLAYWLAFKYKLWPRFSLPFRLSLILALAFLPLALIQSLVLGITPVVVAYGWRNYFFYLPFAFLIGENFRGKDLKSLVRYTLLVAVPIAILCYKQFSSPSDDVVNLALDGAATHMLVARDVVRTSGTFTVASAQAMFIGSIFSMLLAVWLLPASQRPLKRYSLWIASAACLTTLAVSGARGSFVVVITIVIAALASLILTTNQRRVNWVKILTIPLLLAVGWMLYVTVFNYAFIVMGERWSNALNNEGSIFSRVIGPFAGIIQVWPRLSLLGCGIGTGTNAGAVLTAGHMGILAEDEWSRILLEAGIFGVVYIAARIFLTGWLAWSAAKAVRRSYNPLPLLLCAFLSSTLLVGQMTMQGTINGYAFLFIGFCLAANRLGLHGKATDSKHKAVERWQ